MIKRLEKAGLGFYVRASETQQRLGILYMTSKVNVSCMVIIFILFLYHISVGRIPLRELVYRVLDLPPSMRPLVYDFGQLKKGTEDEYIEHIVHDHVSGICMLYYDCQTQFHL